MQVNCSRLKISRTHAVLGIVAIFLVTGTAGAQTPSGTNTAKIAADLQSRTKQYLDFRADFFNIFNHPNFGPPGAAVSSPGTFGVITTQIGGPRVIQMALKLLW